MSYTVQLLLISIIGIGFASVIPITFITCADVKKIIHQIREEGLYEESIHSNMQDDM